MDPKLDQAPDYLDVIKKPMDLGTIESNLKKGRYRSGAEFEADVNLVWSNCFKYNALPVPSLIHDHHASHSLRPIDTLKTNSYVLYVCDVP